MITTWPHSDITEVAENIYNGLHLTHPLRKLRNVKKMFSNNSTFIDKELYLWVDYFKN